MNRTELIDNYLQSAQTLQRLWKLHFQRFLESSGLSHAQIALLVLISQKQPITSRDIAEQMQISRSAVAQVLDVLDRRKYIVRQASPEDRRTIFISLSAIGDKKLAALNKQRMTLHEALAADMSDEELKLVTTVQVNMIRRLEIALDRTAEGKEK